MTTQQVTVERYVPLDDMQVRSDGGERIIDAYAAAFGARQEIRDREGHYVEEIAPSAFDRTLAQRAGRLQVIFNHGKSMYGTPSERFSMPYGTPIEVRPDERGLFTSTKVAKTELGDEILELANSGALRGQSFGGFFVETSPSTEQVDGLPLKVRTEIALREYGLTPFPYYQEAVLVGVRAEAAEMIASLSTQEIVEHLLTLPEDARSELYEALTSALADTGTGNDIPADTGTDVDHTFITPGARAARLRALTLRSLT